MCLGEHKTLQKKIHYKTLPTQLLKVPIWQTMCNMKTEKLHTCFPLWWFPATGSELPPERGGSVCSWHALWMHEVTCSSLRTAVLLIFTAHGLNTQEERDQCKHLTTFQNRKIHKEQVIYIFHRTAAPAPIRHLAAGGLVGTLWLLIRTNYCSLELKRENKPFSSMLNICSRLIGFCSCACMGVTCFVVTFSTQSKMCVLFTHLEWTKSHRVPW